MRIIGGLSRGTKLYTLDGLDTRPTLDRVREALFNILQNNIRDAIVLDLFAGSGAIGLESISRGAQKAVLCDKNKKAIDIIKKNVEKLRVEDKVKIALSEYDDKRKSRENIALILPESGHIARSNPPFIMINKKTTLTRISVSKELSFTSRYEYTLRNNSFFSMTNILDNGKWYIAFDENGDTNLRRIYHFFIDDSSTKIIPITNKGIMAAIRKSTFFLPSSNSICRSTIATITHSTPHTAIHVIFLLLSISYPMTLQSIIIDVIASDSNLNINQITIFLTPFGPL